jgi:exonuclease III
MPESKREPGHTGVTLIWDARFAHARPICSSTGRLAGVTLLGPSLERLQVLVVYGPASPSACPKVTTLLHKHFLNELSHCRRNNTPVLILGDFNDVPSGDFRFVNRNSSYPQDSSIINVLENRYLDVFRTIHPNLHEHTFQKRKKAKDNSVAGVTLGDVASSSPSGAGCLNTPDAGVTEGYVASSDSCPPSPTPSLDEESGEEQEPAAHEQSALSLPSRIDSIWAPLAWKTILLSANSRCSVDQSRSNWSFSTTFQLRAPFPFMLCSVPPLQEYGVKPTGLT